MTSAGWKPGDVPAHWWSNGYRQGETAKGFLERAARWAIRRKRDGMFYNTAFDGTRKVTYWLDNTGDLHLETDAVWLQTHLGSGGLERLWVPRGMTFEPEGTGDHPTAPCGPVGVGGV